MCLILSTYPAALEPPVRQLKLKACLDFRFGIGALALLSLDHRVLPNERRSTSFRRIFSLSYHHANAIVGRGASSMRGGRGVRAGSASSRLSRFERRALPALRQPGPYPRRGRHPPPGDAPRPFKPARAAAAACPTKTPRPDPRPP